MQLPRESPLALHRWAPVCLRQNHLGYRVCSASSRQFLQPSLTLGPETNGLGLRLVAKPVRARTAGLWGFGASSKISDWCFEFQGLGLTLLILVVLPWMSCDQERKPQALNLGRQHRTPGNLKKTPNNRILSIISIA